VVPVSDDSVARSFGAQLAELRNGLQMSWHAEAPDSGFVEWAAARSGTGLDIDLPSLVTGTLPEHRWNEAPVLAAIGFRLALVEAPDSTVEHWLTGVRRLMSRDAVPSDRNSFFFRPVELLGLASGAGAVAGTDPEAQRWFRELIEARGDLLARSSVWPLSLTALAAASVAAKFEMPSRLDPQDGIEAAVLFWLYLVDKGVAAATTSGDLEMLSRQLLYLASTTQLQPTSLGEQGVVYLALQRAVAAAVGALKADGMRTADFVVSLCRRFPLLVSELGNRYAGRPALDIGDEYDVQDLLRSVLRLHYEDVRPEEWNPSYGGVQSRSDLLLKAERVVIETKMTRKSLGQRELVEQLIVDKAQYRGHPDCGTLVCFVYDPEHRLSNPAAIERDLSGHEGGLATLVVVSPIGV